MEHLRDFRLLDEKGKPLDTRIEGVLHRLVRRFRKWFPTLRDDFVVNEVFEEAGRKIAKRERQLGPIDKLHEYAWVTLRNAGTSWLRRSSSHLEQHSLNAEESDAILAAMPAADGSADAIEHGILMQEVLSHLSPEERLVFVLKIWGGFTSEQVAYFRGTSANAVNILFLRIKRKIAALLGVHQYGTSRGRALRRPGGKSNRRSPRDSSAESRDDEATPSAGSIGLPARGSIR
jgi:RNA polymerase sigma factor (sigma-70 family)